MVNTAKRFNEEKPVKEFDEMFVLFFGKTWGEMNEGERRLAILEIARQQKLMLVRAVNKTPMMTQLLKAVMEPVEYGMFVVLAALDCYLAGKFAYDYDELVGEGSPLVMDRLQKKMSVAKTQEERDTLIATMASAYERSHNWQPTSNLAEGMR